VNRIALATSLSLLVVFGAPVAALAAFRTGSDAYVHARDNSIIVERGSNARLVFINEKLYPDTVTLAPIDDENATLAYAFSSDARVAEASAAQDDAMGVGVGRILCDETVCWIQ
jgi:hypothetical protein